jgi:hypothetical protein
MNEQSSQEAREVPLEEMREWYRDQVERSTLRNVAPICGLCPSTLHNFVKGGTPHPRNRRLLALAYLREHGATETGAAALQSLVETVPAAMQPTVREGVLQVFRRAYEANGYEAPLWITDGELGESSRGDQRSAQGAGT